MCSNPLLPVVSVGPGCGPVAIAPRIRLVAKLESDETRAENALNIRSFLCGAVNWAAAEIETVEAARVCRVEESPQVAQTFRSDGRIGFFVLAVIGAD